MPRPWSERALAMLGAVWFILIGVNPDVSRACPAHGVAPAASPHSHHAAAMPMDAGSMQHAPSHHAASRDATAPTEHGSHHCTCPGNCCCGPAAAVAPLAEQVAARSANVMPTPPAAVGTRRTGWTDHVLPFGTAPPPSVMA